MCGIVGYGGFNKKVLLDEGIKKISHRGPDGKGIEYFNNFALGNTRLAILDLSANGHMPMFNKNRSLCITFNGEIYNFKEIKGILEKTYDFKSNSDTEAVLYAYQEWGIKCLEKLRGMFSFVIYDVKNNSLFGARDRLGQKPLKYYFDSGKFIFASEIKAILSLLDQKPDMDEIAIDNFLTMQYVPSPRTGFKKIYKLPPGHYFIYKNNKLHIERYWSLDFNKKINLSISDWQNLIFKQIEDSVKSHLISDVPVGVLLSGGLDSSIIVALMSLNSSKSINTFSIGFDDKRFDETKYAELVSQMYGTKHTQLMVTADELMENITHIGEIYDEPIGDNSILPTMLVSKLASSKVKVALTGDGGDENFAGYDRYLFVNLASSVSKMPPIFKEMAQKSTEIVFGLLPNKQTERMNRFFSTLNQPFYKKYINYNCFFTNSVKRNLYSSDFKEKIGENNTYDQYRNLYDKNLNDLDNALKIDIGTYLPDDLLYKTDIASMAYGLELRAPFLDHIFMETIASMPSAMKLQFITKKKILKEIAIKYKLLPREIVYRPKQGFTIPQNKWFKGPLKEYVINTILSSRMMGEVFNKKKIEDYLNDYYKTNLNYDNNIFALFMLALWMDKYF